MQRGRGKYNVPTTKKIISFALQKLPASAPMAVSLKLKKNTVSSCLTQK